MKISFENAIKFAKINLKDSSKKEKCLYDVINELCSKIKNIQYINFLPVQYVEIKECLSNHKEKYNNFYKLNNLTNDECVKLWRKATRHY